MKANEIRDALRKEQSENMDRRRQLVLLSAVGMADFNLISLLQSGVVRRLPDIPYRKVFDTNAVNTSKAAFKMGVPDAVISNVLFSVKMALATAGGSEKASRKPIFDLLLGAVSLGHAMGAAKMTYRMLFKQQKVCIYCLAGAGLIFSSAAVIAPTVASSVKKILKS
ncbi:MAG: vitamin K epoxide reductase family protein [Hymenobacteraceae bacterium]|nr:vitamin K epoxide reductase family protein [Hymenobacteraceae bacterium]